MRTIDGNGQTAAKPSAATVDVFNPEGAGSVVLACEHASNQIPESYADLGLSKDQLLSHIAWDPGALAVAKQMSKMLDAALVAPKQSRLIYDCNRPPEAPGAMPDRSEIHDIPGNRNLNAAERQARADAYYHPFQGALSAILERRIGMGTQPVLVTVHSFTPVYHGTPRRVEIGLLHDTDARLADAMMAAAGRDPATPPLDVRLNEPYAPIDGVTHTLQIQAIRRGLMNVMIEIRNDLLVTPADQSAMGERLAGYVKTALQTLTPLGHVTA